MSFLFSLLVSLLGALGLGPSPSEAHGGIFTEVPSPSEAHGGIFAELPAADQARDGVKKP